MGLSWMAWTWPTAGFFVFIALCLVGMMIWEWRSLGSTPRTEVFTLEMTRGDRLFISLLNRAFIHLVWLGALGPPLWGATAVSVVFAGLIVRWA